MDEQEYKRPVKVADLFGAERFSRTTKGKVNERFELLEYFCLKINPARVSIGLHALSPKGLGVIIGKLNLRDLYFIKSDCDKAEIRGVPYAKALFHLINETKGKKPISRA